MSDIEKASAEAVEAARQGEQFAALLAAIQAAQQAQVPACQHHQPVQRAPSGTAAKWIGIGVGGSFLALSLAISFVAVAIGAVSLTVCVVVLRSVWAEARKGR